MGRAHESASVPLSVLVMWSNSYIGIPFQPRGASREGCDCWGLVRMVYAVELGVDLAAIDGYATAREWRRIAGLVDEQKEAGPWRAVEAPQGFDVALFQLAGLATHVGIVIDATRYLHASESNLSRVERFADGIWKATGFYRHVSRI